MLVRAGIERRAAEAALAAAAVQLTDRLGASSLHLTFLPEGEWVHMGELGLLQRTGKQFHFVNEGYRDFDDFLAALASRKRKTLRKDKEDAGKPGREQGKEK